MAPCMLISSSSSGVASIVASGAEAAEKLGEGPGVGSQHATQAVRFVAHCLELAFGRLPALHSVLLCFLNLLILGLF